MDEDSKVRLVRVETKLDGLIEAQDRRNTDVEKDVADHETRLRRLERGFWLGIGAAAAIGSAAGSTLPDLLGKVAGL